MIKNTELDFSKYGYKMDFWDPVLEASVSYSEGIPKFSCVLQLSYMTKTVNIYLDEKTTRKAARRKLTEGLSSSAEREMTGIIDRIVDDLFDLFGASGYLEWDARLMDRCNQTWVARLLRRDLKKRGLPTMLSRESVEDILNQIYVIEPILSD